MEQYIDKSAVVAEIEKIKHKLLDHIISESDKEWAIRTAHQLNRIIRFINTLEVKEVDLEKEARHYLLNKHLSPLNEVMHQADLKDEMQYHSDIENAFKAGYELGVKAIKGGEK
jgi:PleD family two-component response regulator